jgi:hypothetical protein
MPPRQTASAAPSTSICDWFGPLGRRQVQPNPTAQHLKLSYHHSRPRAPAPARQMVVRRILCPSQGDNGGPGNQPTLLEAMAACENLGLTLSNLRDICRAGAGLVLDRDFLALDMHWTCFSDTHPYPRLLLFSMQSGFCPCTVQSTPLHNVFFCML